MQVIEIEVEEYTVRHKMRELAKIAQQHGLNAVPYRGAVMVWNADGCIAVKTLAQIKEWLEY